MPDPSHENPTSEKNVGQIESVASATIGGALLIRALLPRSVPQTLLLLLGGALLYRGLTSNCKLYETFGINTDKNSIFDEFQHKVLSAS